MRARGRFTAKELEEQVRTIRILGVLAIAMVCVALAIWLAGEDRRDGEPVPVAVSRPVDPIRAEFQRCNALGQAALDDDSCQRAWAEHRRRFFSGGR